MRYAQLILSACALLLLGAMGVLLILKGEPDKAMQIVSGLLGALSLAGVIRGAPQTTTTTVQTPDAAMQVEQKP